MISTFKAAPTIVFVLLAFLCIHESRADDYAVVSAYTHHYGSCVHHTCDTPHRAGWEHTRLFDYDGISSQAVIGTNSYGRPSATATIAVEPIHFDGFRAGALAGFSSGYKPDENRVEPFIAALTASYTAKSLMFRVAGIPPVGRGTIGVIELFGGIAIP